MSIEQTLLIGAIVLALAGITALSVRAILEHRSRRQSEILGALAQIIDQIDAINQAGLQTATERLSLAERIEAQIAATRTDLEWLMGDRLMEMADRFVKGSSSPAPSGQENDLPTDMARTIALFRQH